MTKNSEIIKKEAMLPSRVQSEPSYLSRWAERNQGTFERCMEQLADELPQKYCDLFVKIKMAEAAAQPKQNTNNIGNMNVNINSKLDTLGDIKDTSWRSDSTFTTYEEVNNEK